MSKGWESKNIEEQQAAAADRNAVADHALQTKRADGELRRKIQALEMQRERILSERTSNPHRRNALAIALGEIEHLLQELGLTLKM